MRGYRRLMVILWSVALLAAACGGDEGTGTTATAPPQSSTTTTEATTTTTLPPEPAEWGPAMLFITGADGVVYKVDGGTGEVLATVEVGGLPENPTVGPGGVWVSDCEGEVVHLITPGSLEVAASIPVGVCARDLAAGSGGVLVLARNPDEVLLIDPVTRALVGDFPLGDGPSGSASGGSGPWSPGAFRAERAGLFQTVGDIDSGGYWEGGAQPTVAVVSGSTVTVFHAFGGEPSLLQFDTPVRAAAIGYMTVVVALADGRVMWFSEGGTKLGERNLGISIAAIVNSNGTFVVTGLSHPGDEVRVLAGNPGAGVPFAPVSVPAGVEWGDTSAAAYGTVLYVAAADGLVTTQQLGVPATFGDLVKMAMGITGLAAVGPNPAEGGNRPDQCMGQTHEMLNPHLGDAVNAALSNPATIPGWGQPTNPARPAGPDNPPRVWLGTVNPQEHWNPVTNPLVFKGDCEEGSDGSSQG